MTALEIWLLLCMCFVAMTMFEFAFLLSLRFGNGIKCMNKTVANESGQSIRNAIVQPEKATTKGQNTPNHVKKHSCFVQTEGYNYLFDKKKGKKFFFIGHEVLFYETLFLHRARRIYVCGQSEEVSSSGG
jgi:hypothetical protein